MTPSAEGRTDLDCLAPHVPALRRDHSKFLWTKPWGTKRVRPVAWTCECMAMVYELCHGGGQGFIRRTLQADAGPKIRETHRWSVREADEKWLLLLTGRAR